MELTNIIISLLAVIVACVALYQTAIISRIQKTIGSEDIIFKKKVESYEQTISVFLNYIFLSHELLSVIEEGQKAMAAGDMLPEEKVQKLRDKQAELEVASKDVFKVLIPLSLISTDAVIESLAYIELETELLVWFEDCNLQKAQEHIETTTERLDLVINQLRQDVGIDVLHGKFSDRIGHIKR